MVRRVRYRLITFHRMSPNGEKSKIQIDYLPQDDPEWREE